MYILKISFIKNDKIEKEKYFMSQEIGILYAKIMDQKLGTINYVKKNKIRYRNINNPKDPVEAEIRVFYNRSTYKITWTIIQPIEIVSNIDNSSMFKSLIKSNEQVSAEYGTLLTNFDVFKRIIKIPKSPFINVD